MRPRRRDSPLFCHLLQLQEVFLQALQLLLLLGGAGGEAGGAQLSCQVLQGGQVLLVLPHLRIQLLPRAKGDADRALASSLGKRGWTAQPRIPERLSAGSAVNSTSAELGGMARSHLLRRLRLSKYFQQLQEQVPPSPVLVEWDGGPQTKPNQLPPSTSVQFYANLEHF